MVKFSKTPFLFLLFCLPFIFQFQPATLIDDDQANQNVATEKPLLSKLLMDTVSLLRKSHKSSWDKFKSVIHDLQIQFSPPNLDFRGGGSDGAKGSLKEAVGKSFDKSKEKVEESAETAAKVVEEAFHKTTQKVETTDSEHESKAEL
ncbi:hypothetical protein Fmac_004272 [Flemingia macrophylla]|uniref:Transmembrane protein n=1 Tax=Flemingia macrophylla TaxID=520843 RepID=A0ABD1N4F4_9FABA